MKLHMRNSFPFFYMPSITFKGGLKLTLRLFISPLKQLILIRILLGNIVLSGFRPKSFKPTFPTKHPADVLDYNSDHLQHMCLAGWEVRNLNANTYGRHQV